MKTKHLFLIAATTLCLAAMAQEKELTIQEAIWKGRTDLAPKRLKNIGFVPIRIPMLI